MDLATSHGATELLAFPIPLASSGRFSRDVAEFSGRLSTYARLGFESREQLDDFYQVVVRRPGSA
jgi:hypothetical protein